MLPLPPADSISETRYTGGISEYLNCVPTDAQSMFQVSGYECAFGEKAVQGVPKITDAPK